MNKQNTLLNNAQFLVDKYNELSDNLTETITDEAIDSILWTEEELLQAIDALVLYNRINAERRLRAEKEEDKSKKMVNRIMKKLWLDSYSSEDGSIKKKVSWQFQSDLEKLPESFKMASWQAINSVVSKWGEIPWVHVIGWFDTFSITK